MASRPAFRLARLAPALLAGVVASAASAGGDGAAGADDAGARACVDRAVELVQRRYDGVEDLRARFVQTHESMALGAGRPGAVTTSRGRAAFAKPGRMRWSYEAPEPSLVVSDGRTLWIYDPSRAEVQRMAVGAGFLSGTAIQFLLGEGDLREAFEIAALDCGKEALELDLVPREPSTYERLRMRIDPATGDVQETTVVDLLGNRTRVAFEEIETGFGAEAALFRFDPPEGTRVIDLDAGGGSER
jgi:outer membrane lipoprotein carrier protein